MRKLPCWVSRLAFDLVERELLAARAALEKETARVQQLTDTVIRMKETGAVVMPPDPTVQRGRHRDPTDFELAVEENARARSNARLRSHLLDWAEREKRRPLNPGESEEGRMAMILDRLQGWDRVVTDDEDSDEIDDALRAAGVEP